MSPELRTVPWYDRNAEDKTLSYVGENIAPHIPAVRETYTVPKNRMAFIGGAFADVLRTAAADAVDLVNIGVNVGGKLMLLASHLNNNIGHREWATGINNAVVLEKTIITIATVDVSTGGTMDYGCGVSIIEFDAYPIEKRPFEVELPREDVQEPTKRWWEWWWPF